MRERGHHEIAGPNVVLQQAFQDGYITDAAVWKKMKESRALTSYAYNSDTAEEIVNGIATDYYKVLHTLVVFFDNESKE